jgi:hypothetical protein
MVYLLYLAHIHPHAQFHSRLKRVVAADLSPHLIITHVNYMLSALLSASTPTLTFSEGPKSGFILPKKCLTKLSKWNYTHHPYCL